MIERSWRISQSARLWLTWGGFGSWTLVPTLAIGGFGVACWVNIFWLQGRLGVSWTR